SSEEYRLEGLPEPVIKKVEASSKVKPPEDPHIDPRLIWVVGINLVVVTALIISILLLLGLGLSGILASDSAVIVTAASFAGIMIIGIGALVVYSLWFSPSQEASQQNKDLPLAESRSQIELILENEKDFLNYLHKHLTPEELAEQKDKLPKLA